MERINGWAKKLKTWIPIAIALSGLALLGEVAYLQNLISTGTDPLADNSEWALALPYTFIGLTDAIIELLVVIFLIGFMLRSAQLIKSVRPDEFVGRPGWAIWGFIVPIASLFIPYRILKDINVFAKHDALTQQKNRRLIMLFWIPSAISSYVSNRSLLMMESDPTYDDLLRQSSLDLFVAITGFISLLFLMRVVPVLLAGINKRMDQLSAETIEATS